MEAHAMPTMLMDKNNIAGSVIKFTLIKPNPPIMRHTEWVSLLPILETIKGMEKEKRIDLFIFHSFFVVL
jgi:hypothetical protein